ncbi:MAG: hypothetical protein ABSF69_08840 [Polyangiaceae bacterium]|jgi:hypothetical protein
MNALAPLAIAAAFAAACADGTLPARGARDASNPEAPETPPQAGDVSPVSGPAAHGDDGGSSPPARALHHREARASAGSGASP